MGAGKPVPIDKLDAEYASGRWDHFFSEQETPRFECILEMLERRETPYSLLELGCGSGRLAMLLTADRVDRYLGVDISTEGLKRARQNCDRQFLEADFETWRPSECWDVILFNESIGYARSPVRLAREFCRYLKPGGWMMVANVSTQQSIAQWKKIGRSFETEHATTAQNERGQKWDIKVLCLRK